MELETASLQIGSLLGEKYRIEKVLGRGGMGAVYLAENVDIGRKVAIKVLLPELTRDPEVLVRFRNEARAASTVRHPGIVDMIDLGKGPGGEAFLVMEHLEGESLGARLRRVGRLDLQTAAYVVGEVLDAIGAAHEKGIVHRDLKPDNVFLVDQPRPAVKVLDFGISKFHVDSEPSLTRTATVMGTPAYMAPEQARSARDAGPASDLYAIGAILYEALGGAPPFEGQSYNEIIAKVMTQPHRPLPEVRPDIPAPVVALVDSLLAKDPAARPASAAVAIAQLREAVAQSAGQTGLSTALPETFRRDSAPTSPCDAGDVPRSRSWLVPTLVFVAAASVGTGLGAAAWKVTRPHGDEVAVVPAAVPPTGEADGGIAALPGPDASGLAGPDASALPGPDAAAVADTPDARPARPGTTRSQPPVPPDNARPPHAGPADKKAPKAPPPPEPRPAGDAWSRLPPMAPADAGVDDFGDNPYRSAPKK